ncbi:MAG TPA: tetratricopeptide repeat protein [Rhodocyclaceae bacterium]|nr:tetratricopeptide repeat protein [Rhodocyclaceae bacterium]
MSLINDMLNDLEARRATEHKRGGLQNEVRPLPRVDRSSRRGLWWLLGLLLVAGVALGGYGWWSTNSSPVSRHAVPVPAVALPSPPAPEIHAPVVVADAAALSGEMMGLRTSAVLSVLPSSTTNVVTTSTASSTTTTLAVRPAPLATPSPSTPTQPPAANKPVADSGGAIDKRSVYASPRERLESEVRNAVQAASNGRANEAVEQLRDILRQEPTLSLARQALLRILLEQRRTDDMMAVLAEGLDLQPNQTGWAISLARLSVERNDYTSALRILARSYPHAAANPDYLGFFAHVQYKQGHHREAADLYQAAAKQAPGEGRWWLGLGVALEADGRVGEAREAYRKALATGSLNADLGAMAEQKLR